MNYGIAVLGAGPHGRSIMERISGSILFDDDPKFKLESLEQGARAYEWVVGAAWPWVRSDIVDKIGSLQVPVKGLWSDGFVILPGAQVSREAGWGQHVHVCHNAVVSHGCYLDDFVTVCPGAVLAGDVTVGEGTLIGANATIIHSGITIGSNVRVGAGAVVIADVPDGITVAGNPARRVDGPL